MVASRSYISYSKRDLENKLSSNPYSFIHIINPEFGQPKTARSNSKKLFLKIREKFETFFDDGVFIQDEKESLYIYQQEKEGRRTCGIIALASARDYGNGIIKKHEQTLTKREALFRDYLQICDFQAEPVLLTYPDNSEIKKIIEKNKRIEPSYDLTMTSRVRHTLWKIRSEVDIRSIEKHFESVESLYIADGHHRTASSYLLSETFQNPEDHPYNYFMSYLVPESDMIIHEFDRVVKDLNGLTEIAFLDKLSVHFQIEKIDVARSPSKKGEFVFYFKNSVYKVTRKFSSDDLDTRVLNEYLFGPILGIKDLRNDKRIGFVGGDHAGEKLMQAVDSDKFTLGIRLFPVSMQELKKIADEGKTMPPKSTWIEPKLRSGFTIYSYSK